MRTTSAPAVTATVLDVHRIVADGYHNAFCSLVRWRDDYYLAFRQAQTHNPVFPGTIQIWRCPCKPLHANGRGVIYDWKPCAILATGGDDRDPKLVPMDDGLAVIFGTYYPRWPWAHFARQTIPNAIYDLISHSSVSRDGSTWSTSQQIYRPNYWIWSVVVTKPDDYQAMAYHSGEAHDGGSLTRLSSAGFSHLWYTQEFLTFSGTEAPAEPALASDDDTKEYVCCVRNGDWGDARWGQRRRDSNSGLLATRWAWIWTSLAEPVHAPALLQYGPGWLVAGRMLRDTVLARPRLSMQKALPPQAREAKRKASERWVTGLGLKTAEGFQRLAVLPSWGDNSYPGMVWEDPETVLLAYYSQHMRQDEAKDPYYPTPADIFIARIRLEQSDA